MARREESRSTIPVDTTVTASSLLEVAESRAAVLIVLCSLVSVVLVVAAVRRCVKRE